MSFGFGIGDAIAVADLVLRVKNQCTDAPDTVGEAVKEVDSLKMTMKFLGEKIEKRGTILKLQSEMATLVKAIMKDLKGDLKKIQRHIKKWIQISRLGGLDRHLKKAWFIFHDMGELEDLCHKLGRHDTRIRRIQQDLQQEISEKVLALLTRSSMKQDAKEMRERKEARKKLDKFVKEKGPDMIAEAARSSDPQAWIQLKNEIVERGTSPVLAKVMMEPMKERLSKLDGSVVAPSQLKPKPGQPKPKQGQSMPKEKQSKPENEHLKAEKGQPKPGEGHQKPEKHPKPKEGQSKPKEGHSKPGEGQPKPEKHSSPKEGQPKPKEKQSKPKEEHAEPKEHPKPKGHPKPGEHPKSEEQQKSKEGHPMPEDHPKLKEVQQISKEVRASILCVHGNERVRSLIVNIYLELIRAWTANTSKRWLFERVDSASWRVQSSFTKKYVMHIKDELHAPKVDPENAVLSAYATEPDFESAEKHDILERIRYRKTRGIEAQHFDEWDYILCFDDVSYSHLQTLRTCAKETAQGKPQKAQIINIKAARLQPTPEETIEVVEKAMREWLSGTLNWVRPDLGIREGPWRTHQVTISDECDADLRSKRGVKRMEISKETGCKTWISSEKNLGWVTGPKDATAKAKALLQDG